MGLLPDFFKNNLAFQRVLSFYPLRYFLSFHLFWGDLVTLWLRWHEKPDGVEDLFCFYFDKILNTLYNFLEIRFLEVVKAMTLKQKAVALIDTLPPTKIKKAIEYLEYLRGEYDTFDVNGKVKGGLNEIRLGMER